MKMKKYTCLIITLLFYTTITLGQKLSLTDLENISNKTNWEYVNQYLMNKGWEYYESEKGNSIKYNTITWSYNKSSYNDKAEAWFYLFTYEGFPNKISYSVFNKPSYSIIHHSISSKGYKLSDSEIEDNEIISTYTNSKFILKISTAKRDKDDDYSYYDKSITAYNFLLIKKSGIYDPDNGKKTDYYYGDVKQTEYILKDGKMHGTLTVYNYDGSIKKKGNYTNGKANGKFIEYDEFGNKTAESSMVNDEKNGLLKVYENGKISYSTTFKGDKKNGKYTEYYYDDENGNLNLRLDGEYLEDEKSGKWKLYYIEEDKERLLTIDNYSNGVKNGAFQEVTGDSLIMGSYRNGEIHGEYKIYQDFLKTLIGGVIRTDTSDLTLIADGTYYNGLKSSYWKNYDLTGALRSDGHYSNDKKTGEWKYYYTKWSDGEGGSMPYSGQLFLVQHYSNDELNGKSTRYSYLNEEEYPCSEKDENKNNLDTCKRFVYQKVLETSFYKDDKLNGAFELRDSTNTIIAKGFFKDDLKDGEWLHRYSDKDINNESYYIYQKGNYKKDKREGKWIQYYTEDKTAETFNYKDGELHGEYITWNQYDEPREKKQFSYGELKELITYDSLGINPVNKYEIYDEQYDSYKCRRTEYIENGYVSQEYWVKKDKEIDYHWFEFTFLIAINKKLSDGTTGFKDGDFKLVESNSQPKITGKFYKEDRIGLWTFYYNDQNVKIESNYTKNKQIDEKYLKLNGELYSGEFVYYDNENGIKELRKIKDGLRNGKTTYIDIKTNKTIKKERYKNGELK